MVQAGQISDTTRGVQSTISKAWNQTGPCVSLSLENATVVTSQSDDIKKEPSGGFVSKLESTIGAGGFNWLGIGWQWPERSWVDSRAGPQNWERGLWSLRRTGEKSSVGERHGIESRRSTEREREEFFTVAKTNRKEEDQQQDGLQETWIYSYDVLEGDSSNVRGVLELVNWIVLIPWFSDF